MKMKHQALTIFLMLLLAVAASAQDTTYARRVIQRLTAPEMHGRGAAYQGDLAAANYIRSELVRLQVKDLAQSYFQSFSYNTCSMEGQCWIEVGGRRLRNYEEFRVMPWSCAVTKPEARLERVTLETFLDGERMHTFVQRNEKALSDAFIYLDLTEGTAKLSPSDMKRISELRTRNPFGSKGILVGRDKLGTFSVSDCGRQRDYAYIEVLASAMPRKAKSISLCVNTQYRPAYRSQNVWGMIEGKSDSMIVITAHYDHLGTMGDGYKWMKQGQLHQEGAITFPGAHDNASGVAAVLDIARTYTYEKPSYTLVFIFFAGEEAGLKGSTYAAEHPLVDFAKVKLLINIDMFCGGDEGLMMVNADSPATSPYYERLKTLNDALQLTRQIGARPNAAISDHYPFRNLCPAVYFYTMGQRYGGYHDPYDTCPGCSLEHYYNHLLLISSLLM